MNGSIFTIGHSNHSFEAFFSLLSMNRIQLLVDIRSHPFSRYLPHFNQHELHRSLTNVEIGYCLMKDQLGGLSSVSGNGPADYERMARSVRFQEGIEQVLMKQSEGARLCLMCAEKDPIDCHRGLLVSRALFERGSAVEHILYDGTIESHAQMETRLVQLFYPPSQVSLFDDSNLDQRVLAYRKQANRKGKSQEEEGEE